MAQTKDGSLITTGIESPDTEQLVQFGGMSPDAARLVRQDETPGTGIIRPQGKKLPAKFAGAVLIGEPRDTKIILTGSFVGASNPGIVMPTAADVANVNNGTYTPPKLVK
jgi:hypothetical protein